MSIVIVFFKVNFRCVAVHALRHLYKLNPSETNAPVLDYDETVYSDIFCV